MTGIVLMELTLSQHLFIPALMELTFQLGGGSNRLGDLITLIYFAILSRSTQNLGFSGDGKEVK